MRPSETTQYQSLDYAGWGKDQAGNAIGSTGRFRAGQFAAPTMARGPLTYPGVGNQTVGPNPYGSVPTLGGGNQGGGLWSNIWGAIQRVIPGLKDGGIARAGRVYNVNEQGQEKIMRLDGKGPVKKIPKKVKQIQPKRDMAVIPNPNTTPRHELGGVPTVPSLMPAEGDGTNWTQTPALPDAQSAPVPLNTMPSLIPGKAGSAVPYDNPMTAINARNAPPNYVDPGNPQVQSQIDTRGPQLAPTAPTFSPRIQAELDQEKAMAAPVQKQGKWAQAGWMGLQGIQKFMEGYNGNFSGAPVQWLGQAKHDYNLDQANKRVAPYLQQDQLKAGQAMDAAKLRGMNANATGQELQNRQTELETIMRGKTDMTFTDQDVADLKAKGFDVRAGSWANQTLMDRINGISYTVDQRGNVRRLNVDQQLTEAPRDLGNGATTTAGHLAQYNAQIGALNQRQQGSEDLAILKGRIQAVNKTIKGTVTKSKDGPNSKVAPKLVGANTEMELAYNEAQKYYQEAEKISSQYVDKSGFEWETQGKEAYQKAIDKAEKAVQKAEGLKGKINELNSQ